MIIATGTGRCGTKTMAELFDMHHEWKIRDLIHPWYWQPGNQGDPWPDRLATMMQHLSGQDLKIWRESNNVYIHFIPQLSEMADLSGASFRLVWLIRDPREFCRSAIARKWHTRGIWSMCPDRGRPSAAKWEGWSDMQRTAWIWSWRNNLVRKAVRSIPDESWMMVRTQDIYPRAEEIARLYGIDPDPEVHAAADIHNANPPGRQALFPHPGEWTDAMNRQLLSVVKGLPRSLGFDDEVYR